MLARASYDTGGKREIRKRLCEFASNNIPGRRWDVLCMPGHECYEIQDYDNLGIPRRGITAVENRPVAAEMIRRKCPDIDVVEGDLLEFLRKTEKKFDLVHLDFTGGLSPYVRDCLRVVSTRLKPKSVVAVQVFGQREHPHRSIVKTYLDTEAKIALDKHSIFSLDPPQSNIVMPCHDGVAVDRKGLLEKRGDYLTYNLVYAADNGGTDASHRVMFWLKQQTEAFQNRVAQKMRECIEKRGEIARQNIQTYYRIGGTNPSTKEIEDFLTLSATIKAIEMCIIEDLSLDNVWKAGDSDRRLERVIIYSFWRHDTDVLLPPNRLVKLERYEYLSNRAHMLVDFAAFSQWDESMDSPFLRTVGPKIDFIERSPRHLRKVERLSRVYLDRVRNANDVFRNTPRIMLEVPKDAVSPKVNSIKEVVKQYVAEEEKRYREERDKIKASLKEEIQKIEAEAKRRIEEVRKQGEKRLHELEENHEATLETMALRKKQKGEGQAASKGGLDPVIKAQIMEELLTSPGDVDLHSIAEAYKVPMAVIRAVCAWRTMFRSKGMSDADILAKYTAAIKPKSSPSKKPHIPQGESK